MSSKVWEWLAVARDAQRRAPVFATVRPTLWPHMLLPRSRQSGMPFPFGDPSVRYFHLGRNGVYQVAHLLGLRNQEVLFPAYCHGVELEALLAAGVRPVYFPVGKDMRIDLQAVTSLITPRTRGIYLTHYVGFPGPVAELSRLCRERGLLLIEDCALALLSCLDDRPLGTFGDAAVFCLYKTLPTPNGGAITVRSSHDEPLMEGRPPTPTSVAVHTLESVLLNLEMRSGVAGQQLRRGLGTLIKGVRRVAPTSVVATGTQHFNPAHADLRMGALSQIVIRAQDYPLIVARRRRNYTLLLERLGTFAPPVLGKLTPGVCPLFYPVRTRNQAEVMARLRAAGVETADFWDRPHEAVPVGMFPDVEELRRTVLWLPCHQDLTPAMIDRMAVAARQALEPIE